MTKEGQPEYAARANQNQANLRGSDQNRPKKFKE